MTMARLLLIVFFPFFIYAIEGIDPPKLYIPDERSDRPFPESPGFLEGAFSDRFPRFGEARAASKFYS